MSLVDTVHVDFVFDDQQVAVIMKKVDWITFLAVFCLTVFHLTV